MDIYEWAKEHNYLADYYDQKTGYIYCIQEFATIKDERPDAEIRVVDAMTGETVGFARRKETEDG